MISMGKERMLVFAAVIAVFAVSAVRVVRAADEGGFVYDDHDKRDPFWKLIGHRGTIINYDKDIRATDLVLEGVMAEPSGASAAIINGSIVVIGDKIGLFIIKDIQPNEVTLEKGQESFILKLKKEE